MSPELRAKYERWLSTAKLQGETEVEKLARKRAQRADSLREEREKREHRRRTDEREQAERDADEVYPIGSLWWVEVLHGEHRSRLLRRGVAPVVPAIRVVRKPTVKSPPEYHLHRGWSAAGLHNVVKHEDARPLAPCPLPDAAVGVAAAALLTEDD